MEDLRRTVRRRLIGASVLVIVAVLGLPWLFDGPPRPVALDIPIEIPSRDTVLPLPASAQPAGPASSVESSAVPPGPPPRPASAPVITETAAEAGREIAPAAVGPASASTAQVPASVKPEGRADPPKVGGESHPAEAARSEARGADRQGARPDPKRDPAAGQKAAADAQEAARALAALEARPAPASASTPTPAGSAAQTSDATRRFVVQVGAFSEAGPLREARQKVEKLGLKTYTQVVDTPAGERTRVRVGPYGDRAEADRAAAQIRRSGFNPVVLTL